jgi:hypothetical protein
LEQRGAFAEGAGAGLVCLRADVAADAGLVGLVGVPVDESTVVIFDEYLPLVLRQRMTVQAHHAVGVNTALLACSAEGVGTRVAGVGEDGVHGVVGRFHPGDLLVAGDVSVLLQRQP